MRGTILYKPIFRENCEPAIAKSIRKFYRRPYFLPPMAEAAAENWIFVSYDSGNNETNMKREYVRYCEASENISFVETPRNF